LARSIASGKYQQRKCQYGAKCGGNAIGGDVQQLDGVADMLAERHEIIEQLAFPYKAPDAYRALLDLGIQALPEVRAGLRHDNPDVRLHCCRFLDRYLSPDTLADLMGMLNDGDERVRCSALHTLACDRCKDGTCRPEEAEVLPKAMKLLARDPDAHVRGMAIEVVGQFVHTNGLAAAAISAAQHGDENPTVRKKAGRYVPGGPIHRRTKPRLNSISSS
jgi:HEAT repeat protein